jgi:hypothetical protein
MQKERNTVPFAFMAIGCSSTVKSYLHPRKKRKETTLFPTFFSIIAKNLEVDFSGSFQINI